MLLLNNLNAKVLKGDFKIVLNYTTQLKFREVYGLERRNGLIYLNGVLVPREKMLMIKNSLSFLLFSKHSSNSAINCDAGHYRFKVLKSNIQKNEQGCLGDKRFASLFAAFKSI